MGVGGLILFILAIVILNFGTTWLRAYVSGAKVTFMELIQLQLRKIPIRRIVDSRITAVKSGIPVSIDDLSTHFLAGGHVEMVVASLINAQKANIDLTFDRACAIDLATKGTDKNVEDAVHRSVNPQVIDVPPAGGSKKTIDGVAKDGIMILSLIHISEPTRPY